MKSTLWQTNNKGFNIVSGGTDCHSTDRLNNKKVTGKLAEESLDRAGITCNKNGSFW